MEDWKRQRKAQYKSARKQMGVVVFECMPTGKKYVGVTQDVKGTVNSIIFRMETSFISIKNLMNDWKTYGKEQFDVYLLEELPYDEKSPDKSDYSEDLLVLRDLLTEKMDNFECVRLV